MAFKAALNSSTSGCPVDLLQFDTNNPRLEDGRGRRAPNDQALIKSLREVAALGELVQSICANGYKDIEPLIVMGPENGPFRVLEGNRRLASIKLIGNRALAQECGISIPTRLSRAILKSIEQVTVYRVASEAEARAYIGFKHINGPHRWESYAKATFVTEWYKSEKHNGLTIDQIAENLGDDNKTIRNMIGGMLVLHQAIDQGFKIENRFNKGRFAFSHLYTALTRTEYMEFLGLDRGWAENPRDKPVSKANLKNLSEVMLWLFGAKDLKRNALIVSQNPDLAVLGQALKHPSALRAIRSGRSLAEAQKEMRPVTSLLSDVLVEVNHKMREAVSLAGRASSFEPAIIEDADQIFSQAGSLKLLVNRVPPTTAAGEVAKTTATHSRGAARKAPRRHEGKK